MGLAGTVIRESTGPASAGNECSPAARHDQARDTMSSHTPGLFRDERTSLRDGAGVLHRLTGFSFDCQQMAVSEQS